ncbi:MAG TPA: hypothetical protein PLV03_04810 [Clostridiales bacterium]|nr:hypothetical protein [Clostridiales bacterium]
MFTREALANNPLTSTEGGMEASKKWAALFVEENYKDFEPYDITIKYRFYWDEIYILYTVSGDKKCFAIIYYTINFNTKLDLRESGLSWPNPHFHLQVVMKNDSDQYSLIGFVTNQDKSVENSSELVDFISGVPGYESTVFSFLDSPDPIDLNTLGTDFIEKSIGESGLSVINLSAFVGDLKIRDLHYFPDNVLAVLVSDANEQKKIMVFAAEEMEFLYEIAIEDSNPNYLSIQKINQETILRLEIDGADHYYTITQSGLSEFAQDRFTRYRLSYNAYIIEEKNNLVLEQNGKREILLEGIYPEDDDDDTTWNCYFYYCRINNTRFIYKNNGYEWFNECGVFDIATGEATVFTHKDAPRLYIKAYTDGKAILIPDDWSYFLSIGPYLYDESTGELTDLHWLDGTYSDGYYSSFALSGNLLAVVIEDYPLDSFRIFDLTTQTEILNIPFIQTQNNYLEAYSFCATENYFWFSSEYSNYYLFRFPIER